MAHIFPSDSINVATSQQDPVNAKIHEWTVRIEYPTANLWLNDNQFSGLQN